MLMHKLAASLGVFLFFISSNALCQYTETIASGRPGQANGPRTVGAKTIQLQSGVGYSTGSLGNNLSDEYGAEAVLRIGILERFEIAGVFSYATQNFRPLEGQPSRLSGFSSPQVRARLNLIEEQSGLVPIVAIQGGAVLPAGQGDLATEELLPFGRLMAGYSFFDRVNLVFNYQISWSRLNTSPNHRYIASFSVNITDKLGALAEAYGDIYKHSHSPKVDYGIFYLLNKNLQLDINAGGHTITGESDPFFINGGISWRMRL